jgi:hypothetical protein
MMGVHTLRISGCRNTETHISTKFLSGFRKSGFRDVRGQEVSHLGFPGAETPNHIYTNH